MTPIAQFIAIGFPIGLGVVMIGTGGLTFAGPLRARENFANWGYPAGSHRLTGAFSVVVGTLLVVPLTARVGAIATSLYMFAAVATLVRSRDWGHLPVTAILTLAAVAATAILVYGESTISHCRIANVRPSAGAEPLRPAWRTLRLERAPQPRRRPPGLRQGAGIQ